MFLLFLLLIPFGNFLAHVTQPSSRQTLRLSALISCNPACPSLLVHIRSGRRAPLFPAICP
ncbi:hypothetical protein PAHAL_6G307700 [Panicum hallii]|uniref:Uncharacterized protein n=1 Tax=Panicum hallii TaxID=206008 RepID=A0A2T8IIH5_9POAL|nr:hypothetical protein PAHAL_6G307700 [Panicum hallii]